MKRGAINHPKMTIFMTELGIPRYAAVGLLETLWHWAPNYAVQGDIGKWSDAAIAKGVEWDGPPEKLIDALLLAGWVDRVEDPQIRLVIHDIQDHADNAWKQRLVDLGLKWWDGSRPRMKGQGKRSDRKPTKQKKKPTSSQPPEDFKSTSSQPPLPDARSLMPELKKENTPPAPPAPPADAGSKSLSVKDLVAEGVDPAVAEDWFRVRKAKRAPLTRTAWEAIKREAAKAKLTPGAAVRLATERNWQGFNAEWVQNKTPMPTTAADVKKPRSETCSAIGCARRSTASRSGIWYCSEHFGQTFNQQAPPGSALPLGDIVGKVAKSFEASQTGKAP